MPSDFNSDDRLLGPATSRPTSRRRTWPQRLTIALIVLTSLACFGAAAALGAGQWVVSNRNLVVLATEQHDASATTPDVVLPGRDAPAGRRRTPRRPRPRRRSRRPIPRPRTSSSPVPTTTRASIPTRRTPARSATARTRRAQRHDHGVAGRPGDQPGRRAVVPARPVGRGRRREQGTDQHRLRARRPARAAGHDLLELPDPDRPLHPGRLLRVQAARRRRRRRRRCRSSTRHATTNTGLDVPVSGGECFTFDGDHALAYVRSRHYEYFRSTGSGRTDGTSDLGRISRQQDFLRRSARQRARTRAFYDPSVARR